MPVLDDGDPCTNDTCDNVTGVQHVRPDPSAAAMAIDPTVASTLYATSKYIYTGSCPLQKGLTEAIDPAKVTVLVGRVHDVNGNATPGVRVTALGRPTLGDVFTRADGHFEIVVNAGATLVLDYQRSGYLGVQRSIAPKPGDYAVLPDVIVTKPDPVLTPVSLNQSATSVARGSMTNDSDGARQATILFPPSTSATMTVGGSEVALSGTVHVRATEFTTTAGGPAAMPGELPPASAFTYAVDLSLQEAEQQGATSINFNDGRTCTQDTDCGTTQCVAGHCARALPIYLENFLRIPVGSHVPSGYYDRVAAKWVASDDGRVIKIVGTQGGIATVDTDGDGVVDDGSAIGLTSDELARLAHLYGPTQELWRVPVTHFTPYDFNWPYGLPDAAMAPGNPEPQPDRPEKPDCQSGSIIECQTQRLGERIPVVGTPFTLNYRSDRVPGRRPTPLLIAVTGPSTCDPSRPNFCLPPNVAAILQDVSVTIDVGGRSFRKLLPPRPDQVVRFPDDTDKDLDWDGKNKDGILLQGVLPVAIRIGYDYQPQLYTTKAAFTRSFGILGKTNGAGGATVVYVPAGARHQAFIPVIQPFFDHLGSWDARGTGIGGWTLDINHVYDLTNQILYLGNGDIRTPKASTTIIDVSAGSWHNGVPPPSNLPGSTPNNAKTFMLAFPDGMAIGPDGTYFSDRYGYIGKVTPDGEVQSIAGWSSDDYLIIDYFKNGPDYVGPAGQVMLNGPSGIAFGPDGSLYVAERGDYSSPGNARVRKVKNNNISSFAGCIGATPARCPVSGTGDGGPASNALLKRPRDVAVGQDGNVYIADEDDNRIRRVATDGTITTFAGNGSATPTQVDSIVATSAAVIAPHAVAVGPDGSVYFGNGPGYLNKVTPDGIMHRLAGGGGSGFASVSGYAGDGRLAADPIVRIGKVSGISVRHDGMIYFTDEDNNVVRVIDSAGTIATLAGVPNPPADDEHSAGNGGPSAGAHIHFNGQVYAVCGSGNPSQYPLVYHSPGGHVAVAGDGSLYLADMCNFQVRQVSPVLPGLSFGESRIASEDGSEVYFFSANGKHERTVDALTGAVKYEFIYDPTTARLARVNHADGRWTEIQSPDESTRNIIAHPFGQTTTIKLDNNGYVQSITNPATEQNQFTYYDGGLMATLTDPRSNVHTFWYEADGRLKLDADPPDGGGSKTLTRAGPANDYTVTVQSALLRNTKYEVATRPTIDQTLTSTDPAGFQVKGVYDAKGKQVVTLGDGSMVTTQLIGDGRFGMQAPIGGSTTIATGTFSDGSTMSVSSHTQTVVLNTADDPFSLKTKTDVISVNGAQTQIVYDANTRKFTRTSPVGRVTTMTLDAQGRVVGATVPGLASTSWSYDPTNGLLQSVSMGSRAVSFTPDASGWIHTITAPDGHQVTLVPDAAGRINHTIQDATVLPSAPMTLDVETGYDLSSNLSLVKPHTGQSEPAHSLHYNSIDLLDTYTPPAVGTPNGVLSYHYNVDRQLDKITRSDNSTITFGFEPSPNTGRLTRITIPNWAGSGQPVDTSVSYDPATGYLKTVGDPSGQQVTYSHDKMLLTSIAWSGANMVTGSVLPKFDKNFRLASIALNAATQDKVVFDYDSDGLLRRATTYDDAGSAVASGDFAICRDVALSFYSCPSLPPSPTNGLISATRLGVVTDSYSFNTFAEPQAYSAAQQNNQLVSINYNQRDAAGRLKEKIETWPGVGSATYDYVYDPAGRLTDATCTGAACPSGYDGHYAYDLRGNRVDASLGPWVHDAQDKLKSNSAASFTYNEVDGSLLTKTVGGQTTTYTFDALGNLRKVAPPGGAPAAIDYLVDGSGRRVGKKKGGALVQGFLYQDGLRVIAELDGGNNVVSRFVYGTRPNVPDLMLKKNGSSWVPYRIISDHLGSVRLVVNASDGTVAQRLDYDAWGNVLANSAPGFQPFGFAGGLYDIDTKLVHFGARDYDATVGRWTAKDPTRFGGGDSNLYAYVGNDPINRIDPEGRFWWIAAGAAIGAGFDLGYQLYNNGGSFGSVDWGEVASWGVGGAIAGAGGEFLFGSAFSGLSTSGGLTAVTSWAPEGVTSTIAAGRWVMLGGATLRNWIMSGTGYPFSNSQTEYVLSSELQGAAPEGLGPAADALKTAIGQRVCR